MIPDSLDDKKPRRIEGIFTQKFPADPRPTEAVR
jgi:hypothetical protein